jgi:hypothetical protein
MLFVRPPLINIRIIYISSELEKKQGKKPNGKWMEEWKKVSEK